MGLEPCQNSLGQAIVCPLKAEPFVLVSGQNIFVEFPSESKISARIWGSATVKLRPQLFGTDDLTSGFQKALYLIT